MMNGDERGGRLNNGHDDDHGQDDSFYLDENDSLPWLESDADYIEESGSPLKLVALVLTGLLALALVVGGIYWLQRKGGAGVPSDGDGTLIAAPKDAYKVKPENPEGKTFEGEGDAAFAASEGRDNDAVPAPATSPATPAAPAPAAKVAAAPAAGVKAAETKTADAAAAPAATGGGLVQLGAYSNSKQAQEGWAMLTRKYALLSGYSNRIIEATAEGHKVFRLNAVVADKATAARLCNQLKAEGGSCLIAR